MLNRRHFLVASLGAGLKIVLDAGPRRAEPPNDHLLVLLELTGGNDGLNTVVPYADDAYHRARPSLRLGEAAVEKIDGHLGYAKALNSLARLHQDGRVCLFQGVGVPDPDRSHFTSLDRWHHGSTASERSTAGWLARALADRTDAGSLALPGIAFGSSSLPPILSGTNSPVAACRDLEDFLPDRSTRTVLGSKELRALDALWGRATDRELLQATNTLLQRMEDIIAHRSSDDGIVKSPLGKNLSDTLAIIRSHVKVPAVFIRTGGFDTHARQDASHPDLLRNLDQALAPFVRALNRFGEERRVLVLVYSEFGRRVAENGSRGTDHGTAAPVFLIGGHCPAGVHGAGPDLKNLEDGDLVTTCDFRRVLGEALRHLGHPNPVKILGPEALPLFK